METPTTRTPRMRNSVRGKPPVGKPVVPTTSVKKPRDIDVTYTPNGIEVDNDPECVMQGSMVIWKLKKGGSKAAKARITFEKGVSFFPGNSPPNEAVISFKNGSATLNGMAPIYFQGGDPQVRRDKYTVTYLDSAGSPIADLDPDIRTNGP
jgi:hypothetical protein